MDMIDIPTSVEGLSDPHLAWEAERRALKPRYAEIKAAETTGEITNEEYHRQHGAIMDIEEALLDKIKTTRARTIEGALLQIEVIDRYEIELGGIQDHDKADINARALALGTIRRCLTWLGAHQAAVDSHHEWIEQYRTLDAETAERLGDSIGAAILEDPDYQTKLAAEMSLLNRISLTPPTTVAGALAQLRFWHEMEMSELTLANGKIDQGKWTGNLDLRAQEMALAFLEAQHRV